MNIIEQREKKVLLVIRVLVAGMISAHGWHRLYTGSVFEFADSYDGYIPFGYSLIMLLELGETLGAFLFAWGKLVFPLSVFYTVVYTCAIYFFHAHFGWYMTGGDHNGAEYAVALIVSFMAVGWQSAPASFFLPLSRSWRWNLKSAEITIGESHAEI